MLMVPTGGEQTRRGRTDATIGAEDEDASGHARLPNKEPLSGRSRDGNVVVPAMKKPANRRVFRSGKPELT
jgi:hypothetical protein